MRIIIRNDNKKISSTIEGNPTLSELIQTLNTVILGSMQQAVEGISPAYKEQLIEALFDEYNDSASSLLAQFAPHLELHPTLTAQAIMEAENAILTRTTSNPKKNRS